MSTQLDLLPIRSYSRGTMAGHARGSDTSAAAASDVTRTLPARQARVLEMIRRRPMAAFEVAKALGCPFHAAAPRVTELKIRGLVVPTDERRLNPETGKSAVVWRAA